MQNSTYTITNTLCIHTGISAGFPSTGWGVGAGGVFSRFVEVGFKFQGQISLYFFGRNRKFYDFSALMRLATSRKSIFEPYTSMKLAKADFLSPEASKAVAKS